MRLVSRGRPGFLRCMILLWKGGSNFSLNGGVGGLSLRPSRRLPKRGKVCVTCIGELGEVGRFYLIFIKRNVIQSGFYNGFVVVKRNFVGLR